MTIERETMTREEMEKQTLADLGWTFEGLALLRECDTEDDVRMEMSIGPVRRAFDDLVDARLKIQELEAELTTWRADVKGYASDSIARQ